MISSISEKEQCGKYLLRYNKKFYYDTIRNNNTIDSSKKLNYLNKNNFLNQIKYSKIFSKKLS